MRTLHTVGRETGGLTDIYLSLRGKPPNLSIPMWHRCNNISQKEALLPREKEMNSDEISLFCITESLKPNNPRLDT